MHQYNNRPVKRHGYLSNSLLVRYFPLVIYGLVLIMISAFSSASDELKSIKDVHFVLSGSDAIPGSDSEWRSITLPFNTRLDPFALTPGDSSSWAWFRFELDKIDDKPQHSLLLWRLNLSAQVYFNGEHIGGSRERDGFTTVSWNRPLLIDIQPSVWREGKNEVLIRLTRGPWGGGLAPVLFGTTAELSKEYETRMFRQVEINKALLVFGLTVGMATFFVWLRRRNDPVYFWFSGVAFSWSVLTTHLVIYFNPFPYSLWLPLVHVAMDICILSLYGFVGCLTGLRIIKWERLFMLWTVFASLVHLLSPLHWFFITAYSIHLIGVGVLGLLTIRVFVKLWSTGNRVILIISTAVGFQMMLFIYFAFLMFFDAGENWESSIFYAHIGVHMLLFVFSATLIKRFVDALNETESLNKDLAQKVEESRLVIEKQYAERRVLEMNHAAEQERLKIYRDLHDDVGSRLLTIIHTASDNKLGDAARAALESLRQAVSRANTLDQSMAEFLEDVREETELRLIGSGHEVIWRQSSVMPEMILPADLAFNLNRILKELVSNIIRHAKASRVEVDISIQNDIWSFVVIDNGQGFNDTSSNGNGINNIKARTLEIGGRVYWESANPGMRVSITVPVSNQGE